MKVTQADIDRLEKTLTENEAEARRLRQAAKDAVRDADNAERQVLETRKTLIQTINEFHRKRK